MGVARVDWMGQWIAQSNQDIRASALMGSLDRQTGKETAEDVSISEYLSLNIYIDGWVGRRAGRSVAD
jgi:hypothetical protein